jgi:hypothetical protein
MHQSKYGLGDRRTLDQAIEFSGIDTRNQVILGNRCGNLAYVSFKEHPFGASYIPPYDPVSEVFLGARDPGSIFYNVSCPDMQKKWEDSVHVRNREKQRKDLLGLRLRTAVKAESKLINLPDIAVPQSGIAHIISVTSGDGYGVISHNQKIEGGLFFIVFCIFVGIYLMIMKGGKCQKVVYALSEKGNSVKTV